MVARYGSIVARIGRIVFQIAVLYVLTGICNWIVARLHLPIPGGILGFALLFALLQLKVIRLPWVEGGGNVLLNNLLLLFVPSVVGIVQFGPLVKSDGPRLLCIILTSTVVVMVITGTMADRLVAWQSRRARELHGEGPDS